MTLKLKIDLAHGLIEAEGDKAFVEKVYSDFHGRLLGETFDAAHAPTGDDLNNKSEKGRSKRTAKKKNNAGSKKSSPSCAERITTLHSEGFFKKERTSSEIGEKLREKATPYAGNLISASLGNLVKNGTLRRFKQEKTWMYINP